MIQLDFFCWVILASSAVTSALALIGLISPRFKDTFLQCFTLCLVALSGFIVTLQIYIHGIAQISGLALESLSIMLYSLATFLKYAKAEYGHT